MKKKEETIENREHAKKVLVYTKTNSIYEFRKIHQEFLKDCSSEAINHKSDKNILSELNNYAEKEMNIEDPRNHVYYSAIKLLSDIYFR